MCDLKKKCEDLKGFINTAVPNATVNCIQGPQGAFEIKINDHLIYSKINKKTYPEVDDIVENVKNVSENRPMKPVRPTKDECVLL